MIRYVTKSVRRKLEITNRDSGSFLSQAGRGKAQDERAGCDSGEAERADRATGDRLTQSTAFDLSAQPTATSIRTPVNNFE